MLNDERYWNINLLNKWFAISSIIFMIVIVWMFIDDNDDDFKDYQRTFRKMEVETEQANLLVELEKVKDQRVEYEIKLKNAEDSFNLKQAQLDSSNLDLIDLKAKFYKANMNFLNYKSNVDVQKYNYETEKSHYHGKENLAEEKLYFSMVKDLDSLKLIKESAENLVLNAEKNIKSLSSEKRFAKGELNKVLKEVNLVERKVKKLDREQMSFANKIGDIVRDLPIIDFLSPYYKVEQVVLPDIKYNVNFASVPEVDRCTSCHLGITNEAYKDAPQPFTTHPDLDLYLTSSSPHSFEQFGCTSCHAGRGRGTDFTSSAHTPSSPEQKAEWEEKYHWHEMHHWLKPMLPTRYTEASCFKCHTNENYLRGADKLSLGLQLISQSGCNNCHHIETHQPDRKIGPDLRRVDEKLNKEWTGKWIKNPKGFRHNTKMPAFFGQTNNSDSLSVKRNETEIASIVEYLFPDGDRKNTNVNKYLGDSAKGEELYNVVGCKGCHNIEQDPAASYAEEVNQEALFRGHGANLVGIGSKATPKWIFNWLKNPSDYWHDTAMPSLRLTDKEAKDLTAYLYTFKNEEFNEESPVELDLDELNDITLSWLKKSFPVEESISKVSNMETDEKIDYVADKSIRHYGCYTCHNMDGYEDAKPIGAELTYQGSKPVGKLDFGFRHDLEHKNYAWFYQKLKNPRFFDHGRELAFEDRARMPNFNFKHDEIEALVTALLGLNDDKIGTALLAETYIPDEQIYDGNKLILANNCQGCHIIDNIGGHIAENYSGPEYAPPNLNTEGAKVQPDWVFEWFHKPYKVRPNLQVRMPSFEMSDEEWNSIIKAFQYRDNDLLDFSSDLIVNKNSVHFKAGMKLHELGACNNCHFYGDKFPIQEAQTWAPNLALTKERLQPEWVIEWLRNPQTIMPGTKMPAVYLPDEEILSLPGAKKDWGKYLLELNGDEELMLQGIRDYIYSIEGKLDISPELEAYFKKNGYDFEEEEEDDDDW